MVRIAVVLLALAALCAIVGAILPVAPERLADPVLFRRSVGPVAYAGVLEASEPSWWSRFDPRYGAFWGGAAVATAVLGTACAIAARRRASAA